MHPFKIGAGVIGVIMILLSAPWVAFGGLSEVDEAEKLTVGLESGDFYPYYYQDKKGALVGSDIDLVKDIADKLGARLILDRSARSVDELYEKLLKGEIDMAVSGLKLYLPNAMRITYTKPYLKVKYSLIINRKKFAELRESGQPIDIIRKTKCCKVGVVDKFFYDVYAAELFPRANVVKYADMKELVQGIMDGEVLAGFCDEIESKTVFDQDPTISIMLKFVLINDMKDSISLAVPWTDKPFRAWLNLYLSTYPPNYKVDKLLKKYPLP